LDRFTKQELLLLEYLDRSRHVSQRRVAGALGFSSSQVNRLLKALGSAGLVEIEDPHVRPFNYTLTDEGRARYRQLDRQDARGVVARFRALEARILARLEGIRETGVKTLLFYGAGEILGVTLPLAEQARLTVVGVIDGDPVRHGFLQEVGVRVMGLEEARILSADAVLITTYRHAEAIRRQLGAELRPGCPVFEL
jgi:DNA-binding MarR family transcriptional regulator